MKRPESVTVRQLMEQLQKMNPDVHIWIIYDQSYVFVPNFKKAIKKDVKEYGLDEGDIIMHV